MQRSGARMKVLIVLVAVVCEFVSAGAGAAVRTRRETAMVSVSQTVSPPSVGLTSKVSVNVGVSTQTRGAMTMAQGSVRVSDQGTTNFSGLPAVDYSQMTKTVCNGYYGGRYLDPDQSDGSGCQTTGLAESDITAAFDNALGSNISSIVSQLSSLVKANGASAGVFTYEQELGSTTLGGRQRLVWSAILDPSGKIMYGKSKIVSTNQFYLYISYTPLAVATGLPQSWQYPNAGTLAWTLVDAKMQALQPTTVIDTGGYFDEAQDQVGSDDIVKCIVDHSNAGCGTQYPDVVTLLSQNGAASAYLDVVHAVAPKYINFESPAGSGQYTSVASLTLQVPSREVATSFDPTCLIKSYTYSNSGSFQFNLNHSMTRYFVNKGQSSFSAVAQMATTVISPSQSYSTSLPVDDSSLSSLPNLYIDPFGQDGPLVNIGLLPSGSNFATVDYLPPPACTPVVPPPPSGP